MAKRLVEIYGFAYYKNAEMLMTRTFDIYGDGQGEMVPEPSFLKPEVADDIISTMRQYGTPFYLEADVNKREHSASTKIDWTSANLEDGNPDVNEWLNNKNDEFQIRGNLGLGAGSVLKVPVGFNIPESDPISHIDRDNPFFSAISSGNLESGKGVFDVDYTKNASLGFDYVSYPGDEHDGFSQQGAVMVAKNDSDIHLMQYDNILNKVYISDIHDLPDVLEANLRMTYLARTKKMDELLILDNVHTNQDTLDDSVVVNATAKSDMPKIARDYLLLTSKVKNPNFENIDIRKSIDDKAKENTEARLEKDRLYKKEMARQESLQSIDADDIEFDF